MEVPCLIERDREILRLDEGIPAGPGPGVLPAAQHGPWHDETESPPLAKMALHGAQDEERRQIMVGGERAATRPESPLFAELAKFGLHLRGHEAVGQPRRVPDQHIDLILR